MKGERRTIFARIISMIGSWWGMTLVTFAILFLHPLTTVKWVQFVLWVLVPVMASEFLKLIIKRKRPAMRGEMALVRTFNYSFPSSHVVAAVMIVFWIFSVPEIRWWSWPLLLWPVAVGWSRVWLKAHDLIDVMGGIIFGLTCGILFKYLG